MKYRSGPGMMKKRGCFRRKHPRFCLLHSAPLAVPENIETEGKIFYNFRLVKVVELVCESGYNEHIMGRDALFRVQGAAGARKGGAAMEDWMKRPSDLRRPAPGQGQRRSMVEVPLGSVEVPASRPASNDSRRAAPAYPGRRPAGAGAPGQGRQKNAAGGPPRRPGGTARRGQPARKKKKGSFAGFVAANFAVIFLLAGVITLLIEQPWRNTAPAVSGSAASNSAAASGDASSTDGTAQDASSTAAATAGIGPVQQAQGTLPSISAATLALAENGRVDMSYFDDVLFIGDSLTQGFQVYTSGISNASYAAYIGAGPRTFIEGTVTNINGETVKPIDEILAANPKKVYILLGTNAMETLTDEAFLEYYGRFLEFLVPQLPEDTVYYIEAIPPVTQAKAADENFTLERIQGVNEKLALLAYQHGMYYLDLYSALCGEDGYLKAEYAADDGLHLNNEGYSAWRELLITHTAYRAGNPYLPGSPCYQG